MVSKFHEGFYSFAKYYDIAFDFKDIKNECQFIEEVFKKYSKRSPDSLIEFGAGPALHCLEFAKKLNQVAAVDLSQEMVNYSQSKADNLGVKLKYYCADMVTFNSVELYDVAILLMDSISYLLTNAQVIDHLKAVAKILNSNGLYIIEMSHPRSVFNLAASTVNDWEMERDGVKVNIQWGGDNDKFDPITQTTDVTVKLEYQDGVNAGVFIDQATQRCFTATEFNALVLASNVFEIIEWKGAMNLETPFSNDEQAWRMVPVLRKL